MGVEQRSPATIEAFDIVRERIPFIDRDRYPDVDIAASVEPIQSGALAYLPN